ncbi:hypothetical protein M0802_012143 [Mischocyttarus mexicanus]|nr:hypothetical protein M0802_012143 [Mischocyttarus mexicanus]
MDTCNYGYGYATLDIRTKSWIDYNLQWNQTEYGGVKDVHITPNKLWKPDILMYNSSYQRYHETVAKYFTNTTTTTSTTTTTTVAALATAHQEHQQQKQQKQQKWELVQEMTFGGMPGQKNTIVYKCCPEPYVDVTFTIQIRRRTLYYFFNLIVPCVLISSMALLGFTLPPDSGEKLTLGSSNVKRFSHLERLVLFLGGGFVLLRPERFRIDLLVYLVSSFLGKSTNSLDDLRDLNLPFLTDLNIKVWNLLAGEGEIIQRFSARLTELTRESRTFTTFGCKKSKASSVLTAIE